MSIFFSSDLHLGDPLILKHRPHFSSIEQHDQTICNNILSVLHKRAVLYLLGDIILGPSGFEIIREFRATGATVILILGNHDTEHYSLQQLVPEFDAIHGSLSKFGMWLTHIPLHQDHLRDRACVHGHEHRLLVDDPRFYNVVPEYNDYMPVSLDHIRDAFRLRRDEGQLDMLTVSKLKL